MEKNCNIMLVARSETYRLVRFISLERRRKQIYNTIR